MLTEKSGSIRFEGTYYAGKILFLAKYVICVLHFTPATNSGAGKTHGFPQFPPIRIDKLGLESSTAVTPQLSCEDEPRADQNMSD